MVLHNLKIDLPDPMDLVKGITPQLLLEGALPLDRLYNQGELDALVAAYTAWQAANHPKQITALGEASEGVVFLPVAELKRHY
ncbi:MAG: hypothetical protein A2Y88_10880 [Chloroflexi bacterium RBG_13_48_10]|nr:MAG: hypothetical protein A2Y88_10880 [Chloroflexi bacterium RBG_13_48_10]